MIPEGIAKGQTAMMIPEDLEEVQSKMTTPKIIATNGAGGRPMMIREGIAEGQSARTILMMVIAKSARARTIQRIVTTKGARKETIQRIVITTSAGEGTIPTMVITKSAREGTIQRMVIAKGTAGKRIQRIIITKSAVERTIQRMVIARGEGGRKTMTLWGMAGRRGVGTQHQTVMAMRTFARPGRGARVNQTILIKPTIEARNTAVRAMRKMTFVQPGRGTGGRGMRIPATMGATARDRKTTAVSGAGTGAAVPADAKMTATTALVVRDVDCD
jgi:hypothetical protein